MTTPTKMVRDGLWFWKPTKSGNFLHSCGCWPSSHILFTTKSGAGVKVCSRKLWNKERHIIFLSTPKMRDLLQCYKSYEKWNNLQCNALCSDNDDVDGDDGTISELLYAYCLFASPHARPFDSRLNPILQIFISSHCTFCRNEMEGESKLGIEHQGTGLLKHPPRKKTKRKSSRYSQACYIFATGHDRVSWKP